MLSGAREDGPFPNDRLCKGTFKPSSYGHLHQSRPAPPKQPDRAGNSSCCDPGNFRGHRPPRERTQQRGKRRVQLAFLFPARETPSF